MKIKVLFLPILNSSPDFVIQAIQDYLSKTNKQTSCGQHTYRKIISHIISF